MIVLRDHGVGARVAAVRLRKGRDEAVPHLFLHAQGGIALVVGGDEAVFDRIGGAVRAVKIQKAEIPAAGIGEHNARHLVIISVLRRGEPGLIRIRPVRADGIAVIRRVVIQQKRVGGPVACVDIRIAIDERD